MELKEEKQLEAIYNEFTEAMQVFSKRDYTKALTAFENIIERYKDSEYYSVLEIQTRSKVYMNICSAQLNPVKAELENDEDYLNEGVYMLNAGKYDKALALLEHLEPKNFKNSYVNYLLSIVYLKKREAQKSLEYLKKAVKENRDFKIIAHNDPDFDELFDNDAFFSIVN
jgi:tetratricopeptide (TPR) repeat protein